MVLDSIKRHIGYALKGDCTVEKLKEQTEQLANKRVRLQQSVDEAERNGDHIYENVTNGLSSAETEIQEAEQLIQRNKELRKGCVGLCPNLKTRYQLSKKAAMKAVAIEEPLKEKEFDPISFRPPLQQIVDPFVYSSKALPSRVMILNQVMDELKGPYLNMIGVYGMGGIGKTTLAKEVYRKAVEEELFDFVAMVTVSQTPDLRRIQGEIAGFLGLKFDVNEAPAERASRLYDRLKCMKVLFILDDIWTELDLRSIGIPFGDKLKRSKILIISRKKDVLCSEMGTQKDFSLEVLHEDEARSLFEMTMGEAKDPGLRAIVNEVVERCAGLPLLVTIVAMYLKNKEVSAWRNTLNKLFDFGNEELHEKVHKILKSIYESLPSNEVKSFFLLCALFGGPNIPVNRLLAYAMGLGLFGNIIRLHDARERLFQMIEKLKTESLLLDGDMNGYVKMHGVVLDVARSIATKEQHAFYDISDHGWREWPSRDCIRIALPYCDINELPRGLEYPKAELLSLFSKDLYSVIPYLFFEGFKELKVLNLSGMRFRSVPTSFHFLTNLHSLHLDGCKLDDVTIIGELKQLKFLSFAKSYIIELPKQIEQLSQLKLLDLTNCTQLEVFPANVLSKLSLLEELYMGNSFVKWDVEGNISVMELEELRYLTILEIQVIDAKKMPNYLFFRGLQRYRIFIGDGWDWDETYEVLKTLKLRLETVIHMEDGLKELLRETQALYLDEMKEIENFLHDIDGEGCPQLKHLHIRNLHINSICHAFPLLETLSLDSLKSLKDLFSPQLESIFTKMAIFSNLASLILKKCDRLNYIFKSSTIRSLLQLKRLVIECCDHVEEIILTEESINEIIFPNLNFLCLANLPNLKRFNNGYPIVFLSLEKMEIKECHNLKTIMSNISYGGFHSLFNDKVTFPCLQIMSVSNMSFLEYIWHTSQLTAYSFRYLKSLRISNCRMLIDVFSSNVVRRFQRLENLDIRNCPKIEEIYQLGVLNSIEVVTFELRHLHIHRMHSLKRIWSKDEDGLFSFQNLNSVEAHECKVIEYIFPASIACGLLLLEKLVIRDCWEVELIVGNGKRVETYFCEWPKLKYLEVRGCHKAMKLDEKVSFNLEALILDCKKAIGFSIERFSRLKVIELSYLEDGNSSFPFGFLVRLYSLENLALTSSSLECIESVTFDDHTTIGEGENVTTIIPLKYLKVEYCDRLKHITPSSVSFQNLTTLHVACCEKLNNLVATSTDRTTVHLMDSHIMKEIVAKDGHTKDDEIIFNQLKPLELQCFPALKYLTVESCSCLKNIDASSSVSFKNLTILHIAYCDELENLVTKSTAKTMVHLMELRITFCEMIKEIVANDGVDSEYKIIFDHLKCLELRHLPTLYSFCSGNYVFHFPLLEEVIVEDCLRMKIFCGRVLSTPKLRGVHHWIYQKEALYWEGNLNATIASQCFREKVLQNAFKWYVIGEPSTTKAILANQLQFLINLRKVSVTNCDSIQVVFDLEDASVGFWPAGILQKLEELELINLPTLSELWNKVPVSMFHRKLRLLKVHNCSSLKYVFTQSMISSLIELQKIEVKNCKMMEAIIKAEKAEKTKLSKMTLPSLKKISITGCPNMKGFMSPILSKEQIVGMQEIHEIAMPKLEELLIDWDIQKLNGNNQSDFFYRPKVIELGFPSNNFPTMENLILSDALVEELIIYELDNHHELLPRLRKIILSKLPNLRLVVYGDDLQRDSICQNLQVLQVWECSSLRTLTPSFVYLQNLIFLQVSKCDGLINLITASTAKSLVQLKIMYVGRCKLMEEIVEVESNGEEDEIGFPQLQYLVFDDLPHLKSFCSSKNTFDFPYLEDLFVIKCPKMKTFARAINTPKLNQVHIGKKENEWKWEGALNSTIQALSMEMKK